MFWLSTSTVVRLAEQLRAAGKDDAIESGSSVSDAELDREFSPFCEAMYLMMSADGEVSSEEREVLSGALRNLSDDAVSSELIDKMLARAATNANEVGRAARLGEVIGELSQDKARAEVAFVLAAAIAFADNAIADEENDTLDLLADGLGIDEARADELLDAVEKDLGSP